MTKVGWREFDDPYTQVRTSFVSDVHINSNRQVSVKRIRIKKGGKTVTLISGLEIEINEVKSLLKTFKASCGTGGTYKKGCIELQGDHVSFVLKFLEKQGFNPKQVGGK